MNIDELYIKYYNLVRENGGELGIDNYKVNNDKRKVYYRIPRYISKTGKDELVLSQCFLKFIPTDMNHQMYYDIIVLGFKSVHDRPRCPYCGEECLFSLLNGYRRYCLSHRYSHTSEKVSKALKGRPLSEINKLHLSQAKKGKKLTEEQRMRRPRGYHFKHSEETKRKMSLSRRNAIIRNVKCYKSGVHKSPKCSEDINYLSSYELDFLKLCDSSKFVHKIEIPEPIPYEHIGKFHMYYPDFLITLDSGEKVLVEIKPINLLFNEVVLLKKYSAKKFCKSKGIKYVTLTQNEIYRYSRRLKKKVVNNEFYIYDYLV